MQLPVKYSACTSGSRSGQVVIQPAFADRDRSFPAEPVGQHIEMFGPMFGQPGRMQAVAGIQPRITGRHRFKFRPRPGADRRQHLRLYAGGVRRW
jgi:hypothetical protein